jgi:uncharacterized protein
VFACSARHFLLLAGVLLFLGNSLQAQTTAAADPQKVLVIREILRVTRAAEQVTSAIETGVPAQRAANPRIPSVFWDRFLTQTRARREEFVDSLIPLYSRSFELADLKAMLELYQSPFGQRLLRVQPQVMQESMLLGQRWGSRIGFEIGQQLAAEGVRIQP